MCTPSHGQNMCTLCMALHAVVDNSPLRHITSLESQVKSRDIHLLSNKEIIEALKGQNELLSMKLSSKDSKIEALHGQLKIEHENMSVNNDHIVTTGVGMEVLPSQGSTIADVINGEQAMICGQMSRGTSQFDTLVLQLNDVENAYITPNAVGDRSNGEFEVVRKNQPLL